MRSLKPFEYKGEKYEIRLIKRLDGTWFLKDFKNGSPFSPYYYGVQEDMDVARGEAQVGMPLIDYLVSQVEDGVRFWAENKDNFKTTRA